MLYPSWDTDEAAEEIHELLTLLLADCERDGIIPIVGGDFNARIGVAQSTDDVEKLGKCGTVPRNEHGRQMIRWVLQQGLQILSRQGDEDQAEDSWTCQRSLDQARELLDYILSSCQLEFMRSWCDHVIAVGLDHRCVHCEVRFQARANVQNPRAKHLKSWKPVLDKDGAPSLFQKRDFGQRRVRLLRGRRAYSVSGCPHFWTSSP